MDTLFELPIIIPNPNPMVNKLGKFEGEICGHCNHCLTVNWRSKKYFKCVLRPFTHGAKTDIRLGWDACSKFSKVIPV